MIDYLLNKLSKYLKAGDLNGRTVEAKQVEGPLQIVYAKMYHGMDENRDNARLRLLLGINPATTPWCAAFVNAIERKCGRPGTGKMLARSYLKYGKGVVTPQSGDIVVFKRGNSSWQGHVGYFVSETPVSVLTLGGNQGNAVTYQYYPKAAVLGYRRPL